MRLRQAGIIDYHRAHFELKNKEELETKACECYAVIRGESERLIKDYQLLKQQAQHKQLG